MPPSLPDVDPELPIRQAAFGRLSELTRQHGPVLSWDVVKEGFTFRGETCLFATKAKGIFRPQRMRGSALSIKTTVPRGGRIARYDDNAEDHGPGVFTYRFEGEDPDNPANRLLEQAYLQQIPLIYFLGVAPALYQPLWPVLITQFNKQTRTCMVEVDDLDWLGTSEWTLHDRKGDMIRREYVTVQAKKRLHQALFRLHVLRAYAHRCAICLFPHEPLLHAAHILPDRHERGEPTVDNGLALCLLHHGAFDADLLGIRPDGHIELSPALREMQDGPVLEHALKAFEGKTLHKPVRRDEWPRAQFLEERYARFLQRVA